MFGRLFEGKEKRLQRDRAASEIERVRTALPAVFTANKAHFWRSPDTGKLAMDVTVADPWLDVTGLFLVGILMEFVEQLPDLPTSPYDRAFVHAISLLADCETPFEDARQRIAAVKEQLESLNKRAGWIVSQGREAADDENPSYLLRCHEAARRHQLMSFL